MLIHVSNTTQAFLLLKILFEIDAAVVFFLVLDHLFSVMDFDSFCSIQYNK